MAEDVGEDFVGGDDATTGDFCHGIETEMEVFTQQVATETEVDALDCARHALMTSTQRLVMAGGGDNDIVGGNRGDVGGFINKVTKAGDVFATTG